MKKLAAILSLVALTSGAFAQGTIQFVNSAGPLVKYIPQGTSTAVNIPGTAGAFYFALLTAPVGTTDPTAFSFGVSGTNLAVAGIMRGPGSVPGWAAGTSKAFEVVGWDAAAGAAFNPAWLTSDAAKLSSGMHYWGMTVIGAGLAGGIDASGATIPALPIFGGAGIPTTSSFVLQPIPEPATMALAGLGAAALMIFRRRK